MEILDGERLRDDLHGLLRVKRRRLRPCLVEQAGRQDRRVLERARAESEEPLLHLDAPSPDTQGVEQVEGKRRSKTATVRLDTRRQVAPGNGDGDAIQHERDAFGERTFLEVEHLLQLELRIRKLAARTTVLEKLQDRPADRRHGTICRHVNSSLLGSLLDPSVQLLVFADGSFYQFE